jgi:hypothetical protein
MRPPFVEPSRFTLAGWTAFALLNIVAGLVVSTQPDRLTDFESIARWARAWLVDGTNVYTAYSDQFVDYPPNAIALLAPLGLLPSEVATPAWALLNVVLVCVAPYLAARSVRPDDPFRVIALPIVMFLCWGGVRTLMQFTVAPLAMSMAALLLAERRPTAGGVWLGLAMMKPQVAAPVLLWSVFARRWRACSSAVLVAAGLVAAYCVRAGVGDVWETIARYLGNLAAYHAGDAILLGASEVRPLVRQWIGDSSAVDGVVAGLGAGMLAVVCGLGFREGGRRPVVLYAAPALAACCVLLTVYHLTYGFVILLPGLMVLALAESPSPILQRNLFWILQLGMMFDVPGIGRRAGLSGTPAYDIVLVHADRVLMAVLAVGFAVLSWRNGQTTLRRGVTS